MLRFPPMSCVCVVVAAAVCSAVPAVAADRKKAPNPEKVFARKDANSDGSLSLDEFKAAMPAKKA